MSGHSGTPHVPSYGKYLLLWVLLIALLAAGTFVSYLPISKSGIIGLIFAVSLAKAVLVTLFFMHLKYERLPIWVVALSPFVLILLAVGLMAAGYYSLS